MLLIHPPSAGLDAGGPKSLWRPAGASQQAIGFGLLHTCIIRLLLACHRPASVFTSPDRRHHATACPLPLPLRTQTDSMCINQAQLPRFSAAETHIHHYYKSRTKSAKTAGGGRAHNIPARVQAPSCPRSSLVDRSGTTTFLGGPVCIFRVDHSKSQGMRGNVLTPAVGHFSDYSRCLYHRDTF